MSSEPNLPRAPSVADEGHEATTIVGGVPNNGPGTTTRPTEGTATPLWDLPVDKLETYLPDFAEPSDFDEFWAERLTRPAPTM
nr:acetylxylan esterase [Brachybacterium timonense]